MKIEDVSWFPQEVDGIAIDLGCSDFKRPGFIGVDLVAGPGIDVVCNLEEGLPFKENSIDLVYASHIMEHLNDPQKFLRDIYLIIRPNGGAVILSPHASGPAAFNHIQHKHRGGFGCFTIDTYNNCNPDRVFEEVDVELRWAVSTPYGRHYKWYNNFTGILDNVLTKVAKILGYKFTEHILMRLIVFEEVRYKIKKPS